MGIEKDFLKKGVVKIRSDTNSLSSHVKGVEKGLRERGCIIRYEEIKGHTYYVHFSRRE